MMIKKLIIDQIDYKITRYLNFEVEKKILSSQQKSHNNILQEKILNYFN